MTAIQVLRTILQQLAQPSALAGNDSSYMRSAPASQSSENAADGALKPTPATKAAFKAQYRAVLVEPSGHLNLAAAVSASGLQQVSLWLLHVGSKGSRCRAQDPLPCKLSPAEDQRSRLTWQLSPCRHVSSKPAAA